MYVKVWDKARHTKLEKIVFWPIQTHHFTASLVPLNLNFTRSSESITSSMVKLSVLLKLNISSVNFTDMKKVKISVFLILLIVYKLSSGYVLLGSVKTLSK